MEERDQKRGGLGCALTGIALILLPVLYVLSIGPANLIATLYPSTQAGLGAFYFPIELTAEYFPQFATVLDWYIGLWR